MNNPYKKIASLLILITLAAIIWRERLGGKSHVKENVSKDNPFVDIKHVPLKLDSLEIPEINGAEIPFKENDESSWGRDPFGRKKE